jgi:hypothetical protein
MVETAKDGALDSSSPSILATVTGSGLWSSVGSVGEAVSPSVGSIDGALLGLFEGASLGLRIGWIDGEADGQEDARRLGDLLGAVDGIPEGYIIVGAFVMRLGPVLVGSIDGALLGLFEGASLGLRIGWIDGEADGQEDARRLGDLLGAVDDILEGDIVGAFVMRLGPVFGEPTSPAGSNEWWMIGAIVMLLGLMVGLAPGDVVGKRIDPSDPSRSTISTSPVSSPFSVSAHTAPTVKTEPPRDRAKPKFPHPNRP